MNLPKDPVMLLSVVNTQLRDNYATLAEMAAAYMTDATEIIAKLDAINYHYDEKQNQFIYQILRTCNKLTIRARKFKGTY